MEVDKDWFSALAREGQDLIKDFGYQEEFLKGKSGSAMD